MSNKTAEPESDAFLDAATARARTKRPEADAIFRFIREAANVGGYSVNVQGLSDSMRMHLAKAGYLISQGPRSKEATISWTNPIAP